MFYLAPTLTSYQPPVTEKDVLGTIIAVAIITINKPIITGTDIRFTTSKGEIFAIPETATTMPETVEIVRPKFEACSIGIDK